VGHVVQPTDETTATTTRSVKHAMQQEHSSRIHENFVKQVILLLYLRNTARMTIHLSHGYTNMKELSSVVMLTKRVLSYQHQQLKGKQLGMTKSGFQR